MRKIPSMQPAAEAKPIPLSVERAQPIELVQTKEHEAFELTRRKAKQADETKMLALDTTLAKEQLRSIEREESKLKRTQSELERTVQEKKELVEKLEEKAKNIWSKLKGLISDTDRNTLEIHHKELAKLEDKKTVVQDRLDVLKKQRPTVKRQIEKNQAQAKRLKEQEVIELTERDLIEVDEKLDQAA